MKIVECVWKERFVEKIERKHHVSIAEVEEMLGRRARFDFAARGDVKGEHVYRALGQTEAGRYLAVFFIYKRGGKALILSARDMDSNERRSYDRRS